MMDEFDETTSRRINSKVALIIAAGVLTLCAVGGAAVFVSGTNQTSAVLPSKSVRVRRCVANLRHRSPSLGPAVMMTAIQIQLAPEVCAAAARPGLVRDDGTMPKSDSYEVTARIIKSLSVAHVQTLMFNELAVNPYHLARSGHVTRRDRCLAMMYSGYDALTPAQAAGYPPRHTFFAAARYMCLLGIQRGIIPPSGAPTRADTAALMAAGVAYARRH